MVRPNRFQFLAYILFRSKNTNPHLGNTEQLHQIKDEYFLHFLMILLLLKFQRNVEFISETNEFEIFLTEFFLWNKISSCIKLDQCCVFSLNIVNNFKKIRYSRKCSSGPTFMPNRNPTILALTICKRYQRIIRLRKTSKTFPEIRSWTMQVNTFYFMGQCISKCFYFFLNFSKKSWILHLFLFI